MAQIGHQCQRMATDVITIFTTGKERVGGKRMTFIPISE